MMVVNTPAHAQMHQEAITHVRTSKSFKYFKIILLNITFWKSLS